MGDMQPIMGVAQPVEGLSVVHGRCLMAGYGCQRRTLEDCPEIPDHAYLARGLFAARKAIHQKAVCSPMIKDLWALRNGQAQLHAPPYPIRIGL